MDVNGLMDFVQNVGIWAGLFIYFFISNNKQSQDREAKLLAALDKFAACFSTLSNDVACIRKDVDALKEKG